MTGFTPSTRLDPEPDPEAESATTGADRGEAGRQGPNPEGRIHGYGSELRGSLAAAAARIDAVITAAEGVADEIRREAESEAERYLAMRRREADLEIEEQRARTRRAFENLRVELLELERRALHSLERSAWPGQSAEAPAPRVAADGGEIEATRSPKPPGDEARGASATAEDAGALIRATQLAVIGKTRAEIEDALRTEFGLEHPGRIVDEVLPRAEPR